MSERRRTPSCWSLRLFDLTRPLIREKSKNRADACFFGGEVLCYGRETNPGVVEFGLDADHFTLFFELGAQDAEF